ncbi:uncharacterized protein LOC110465163 [Mizuhopecten yessoensis]|uniref:Ubiquitin-conjugating enzyme E2 J1 n=1 Tax=Mizuhopecten yessoensis TaxID=6573 RepID=A0A210R234_MIZYE|nr:uncharacterized protein LOC110465163 [Mizuhopecten yessoensis]OWF55027.1 Ubiquitin-conjugating enzyme E2 J1 [Mizuhopecten yessoensis]
MSTNQQTKRAIKRLMQDLSELRREPVENVSAYPLDANMFEWHCNFKHEDIIYHLLLFFPENYPYDSPSAEFVPVGFRYNSGATKPGKKGTKVCLDIFSDFADIHTEWKDQKSVGWSPGYTIQTVLLNVVAFLAETQSGDSYWMQDATKVNLNLSQKFVCDDCGHTYKKPFPSLDHGKPETKKKVDAKSKKGEPIPGIIDYMSKEVFNKGIPKSDSELFGYGLIVSGPKHRPSLTTPCETLSLESYESMKKATGSVKSVMREDISYFLPMFIHPPHGNKIREVFESTLKECAVILPKCNPKKTPIEEMVIKVIPNLMSATVVEFSKGTQHTSDNALNGYFTLHRLLLWALDTYPTLQKEIDNRLKTFIDKEEERTKKACPHIGEWLMLLTASSKYRWEGAADAYLSESWKRHVMWYVKDDSQLGFLDTDKKIRIKETFERTQVSRKLLAFQVLFLDIAMPKGMSRDAMKKRYDDNMGFPTNQMVANMKISIQKIGDAKTYQDWFKVVNLEPPTDDEIYNRLVASVKYAIYTNGYHWTFWKTGGGWNAVLAKYKPYVPKDKTAKDDDEAGSSKGCKGKGKGKVKKAESSDDDEEDEPAPAKPVGKGRGKGKAAPVPKPAPKGGGKGKATPAPKPAPKGRGKGKAKVVLQDSDSEDEMEVEPAPAKGRGRGQKRKAEEPAGPKAKKGKPGKAAAAPKGRKK